MPIEARHLEHYLKHGYAIVDQFLSESELASAHQVLRKVLPGWIEFCLGETDELPSYPVATEGRRSYSTQFPFPDRALNEITLHPELLRVARTAAGGVEMYCEQSHLSIKRKDFHDADQGMHCDYGNHTLAYPPKRQEYWQTAYLLYYTDVTLEHGPTAVCSWDHYPETVRWPAFFSREQRPDIYDNEVKATVPAGGLLIYSMRTFHRGTKFHGDGGRIGHFITYSPAAWKWLGIVGWSQTAIRPEFAEWIATATPAERSLLGFPAPGHDYWTDETLQGVSKRFPKMDMTPYIDACGIDVDLLQFAEAD